MSLTRLTFAKDWTNKNDFPTYQDNEAQVRADMQYHPNALRDFINDQLLSELESKNAASSIGAVNASGVAATVQSVLDSIATTLKQVTEDIKTISTGGVPSVVQSQSVVFNASSWAASANGFILVIAESEHKRANANFGYNLYQKIGDDYVGGAPGVGSTQVVYNSDGSVTLTTDAAYAGKIVFFGV
jgi:hypothetical protein